MKKKSLFLLTLGFFSYALTNEQGGGEVCSSTHNVNRFSLRHIESKGIGYDKGYTTLEGFFVPLPSLTTRWIPFLDIRAHIFNNSKPAGNAGLGLRYINSRVWGSNVYYDYRKTSHKNYNQISFGLESLGRYIDYRLNGYFPVGTYKSSLSDAQFHRFSGNSLILSQKQELALKGFNGELGIHIAKVKGIDFYSALGPYYFGNEQKHTFGGEFRIGMDVMGIFKLEGNTSYDHLFKWIGQGQISLSYAFTPKTLKHKQKKHSCSYQQTLNDRAFQQVDKQEIIVTTKQQKKNVAINPLTGLPYVFWFVDNTSHSQGTFESPFNTLLAAETVSQSYDIIAVFPGDGTDTGMNGITLKNGQKLWGMSVIHSLPTTLGKIDIKPLANQLPFISGNIFTANNNDIVGLKIKIPPPYGLGIFILRGNGIYNIEKNIFLIYGVNSDLPPSNCGITAMRVNDGAQISILNNSFLGQYIDSGEMHGIYISDSKGNYIIANNLFSGATQDTVLSNSIEIYSLQNNRLSCSISDNIIYANPNTNYVTRGVSIDLSQFSVDSPRDVKIFITNNKIKTTSVPSSYGIAIETSKFVQATLRRNEVITLNPSIAPAYTFTNAGSASIDNINFAPDNIGKQVYSGF